MNTKPKEQSNSTQDESIEVSDASLVQDAPLTELEQAEVEVQALKDQHLRAAAELDNLRKRHARELEQAHKYAAERFAGELLQVKDSLELALAHKEATLESIQEGVSMTNAIFEQVLANFGIQVITPLGDTFNPEQHEAMTMVATEEHAPNTVMEVVQPGYTMHERVLRPARVVVAKAKEA